MQPAAYSPAMPYTREEIEAAFQRYQDAANEAGRTGDWQPWVDCFVPDVEYVEPVESIVKRFASGGGSLEGVSAEGKEGLGSGGPGGFEGGVGRCLPNAAATPARTDPAATADKNSTSRALPMGEQFAPGPFLRTRISSG